MERSPIKRISMGTDIKGARDFGIASALIGTGLTDLGSAQIEQTSPSYLLERLWEER